MASQMQEAKSGIITDEMKFVAKQENISPELIRESVAKGRIAILKNNKRTDTKPVGIGENLKVKINACLNTSNKNTSLDVELDKLRVISCAGADVLMDVSANDLIDETREAILSNTTLPVGSNPVVQVGLDCLNNNGDILDITKEEIFSTIEKHCSDGVDFIYVNCSLTKTILNQFINQNRLSNILPHSATILACWMKVKNCENPLYEYFDELLDIVKPYDVTLLLGSALKSASVLDASDGAEIAEQIVMGELTRRAREADVQVMIEGIEQVSLNKIPLMVQNIKELTDFAPLYASGAIACDCAVGYDNITSAIGGALAGYQGADMLKAISNVERIGFSKPAQIKEGIMSAKIAAHCADLARGHMETVKQNHKIAYARSKFDWVKQIENSLDPAVFDGMDENNDFKMNKLSTDYSLARLFHKYFSK